MPIPDPQTFRTSTSPPSLKIGAIRLEAGYSGSIAKVLAALESYWENRNAERLVQEGLLYNLWKQCSKWIQKKQFKIATGHASAVFQRRKLAVESLQDEALAQLAVISPAVAAALGLIEDRKSNVGAYGNLVGLKPGYAIERQHYLQTNKRQGGVISASTVDFKLGDNNAIARKLRRKGFGNLTVSDAMKLKRALPNSDFWTVVYRNKIARLQYLVAAGEDGLLCDIDGNPIPPPAMVGVNYVMSPYAMDKYGNLFIDTGHLNAERDYLGVDSHTGGHVVKHSAQFNHSSFLAGSDVLCAGCITIGYDCRRRRPEAGVLGAIDNSSGHYKPSADNLRNALGALAAQGVDTAAVRVGDWSTGGNPRYYWANDFVRGGNHPWVDETISPNHFLQAPPIRPGV